jgi:CubicO group peptidase (beta-lactamase class C family)
MGGRRRDLLRHRPSRPGRDQDRDRATSRTMAVQQLQPPPARDGARARDRHVGVRVHGNEALAAAGDRYEATWSLDSERSGFEKMESGLNATAADYARFGLLFLHEGAWKNTRIVSRGWVKAATSAQAITTVATPYGYFWWIDAVRPQRLYALGNFGQYVYVAPDADPVVVRLGRDWGVDNSTWRDIFREIADQFTGEPGRRTDGSPT